MVANHPGMTDQTSSNIARDGAAKKPQTSFPIKGGMKDQNEASKLKGISPASPGFGSAPDAASPNVLDPSKGLKKFGEVKTAWGMKGTHDPALGSKVLAEASNLGR